MYHDASADLPMSSSVMPHSHQLTTRRTMLGSLWLPTNKRKSLSNIARVNDTTRSIARLGSLWLPTNQRRSLSHIARETNTTWSIGRENTTMLGSLWLPTNQRRS